MKVESNECCNEVLGSKRYLLAILLCLGLVASFAMRCEFGIAIISITESRQIFVHENEFNLSSPLIVQDMSEVSWSNTMVGLIEASFYIGYSIFSIPGGFLSTIFPPNIMFGCAILFSATLNLIIPFLIRLESGFFFVFISRVLQGMAEGCLYPCIHSFWRLWAPREERSKLVTISFFGVAIGPVIGFPISGILTKYYSWSINFYFWSLISFIWVCIWFKISRKSPSQDSCISDYERRYIEENTSQIIVKASDVPWLSIFTSVPVWAIIIANIGRNWTHQFAFNGMPTFLHDKFNISSINLGFQMSAPYLLMAAFTPLGGILADCLIRKKYSVSFVRKLFNSVGFGLGGVCFLILGFIEDLWLTTTIMTLGLGLFGIGLSGYGVNHLDIADIYAGVLMGISNGFGTIAGIIAPIVALELTSYNSVNDGWVLFFVISGVIHLITAAFFCAAASGENQSWSKHGGDIEYLNLKDEADIESEK